MGLKQRLKVNCLGCESTMKACLGCGFQSDNKVKVHFFDSRDMVRPACIILIRVTECLRGVEEEVIER